MKKIFLVVFLFILPVSVFADSCKYKSKIEKCNSALEDFLWTSKIYTIKNAWRLRDFTDFPCIQAGYEARVFQIAMDENFKKIDDEANEFLKNLSEVKNFYFWPDKQATYYDWINDIYKLRDDFKKKYENACQVSLSESAECLDLNKEQNQKWVSVLEAINFISWANNSWDCYLLAEVKTKIFLDVAYNLLLVNKDATSKDQFREFNWKQRENYWLLLEAVRVNQSYIERLSSKWSSKTKHTLWW